MSNATTYSASSRHAIENPELSCAGKAQSLCSRCLALNLSVADFFVQAGKRDSNNRDDVHEPITLDTRPWDWIKNATECSLCQLLYFAIGIASEAWQAEETPFYCQLVSKRLKGYPASEEDIRVLEFVAQYKWTSARGSLIPVQSDAYPNAFPGRRINPGQVDVDQVGRWLQQCETQHDACRQPNSEELGKLRAYILVIDVNARCLTRLRDGCRYLALSYVWGGIKQAEAKLNNLQRLLNPGALDDLGDTVPKTVRDAMEFVKLLGERYLWVDALCIVQDDHATKQSMIEHMHVIYANSYVTLIAASGDTSNAGLSGATPSSRELDQPIASVADGLKFTYPIPFLAIKKGAWATRGWT
jgi:hypothetical protein